MVEGKKSAPRYEVWMKRKVERGLRKLPQSTQETMDYLIRDLKEFGPIRKDWSNFSSLGKNRYHCHLSGSYAACWTWVKGSLVIEVYYAGSREDAPY
jgi:mRNA-degrading endonuclease RelE of RelBE toxin-antitoxin system